MSEDPSRATTADAGSVAMPFQIHDLAAHPTPWGFLLVAIHIALAILVFEPILFAGADAGHYMVLGEALREGLGFRDIHLPGSPLHAKYPPGYPIVLAVTGWLGGLQLFKAVSLLCTSVSVWLAYRIGRPVLGRAGAFATAGLFAVSPTLLDFSHRVLSEAAFTVLLLLVVYGGEREGRWWIGALVAAGAAFLTRTAGLAVLLALVVYELLARENRRAIVTLVVALACVVGWAMYQELASPSQPGYLQQLVLLNPYDPAAGTASAVDFPIRVARNLWRYVSSEFPGALGFPTLRRGTVPQTTIAGVIISGLALAGWLATATRRLTPAHLVTVFYVGLILLWPPVWTDRRFLLPVLPLLVLWMGAGMHAAASRLPRLVKLVVAGFVISVLAGTALLSSGRVIPYRLACQAAYRDGTPCDRPPHSEFYAMARWAGRHVPPGAVVANRNPATFFLLSGRQGDVYRYSRDPDTVLAGIEAMGAEFVVVDRLSATTRVYLIPAINAYVDRFEVVHVIGGEEGTIMLRLLPTPRTASARLDR